MTSSDVVVARGPFSALRELERVLLRSGVSPRIVAPPGCNTNS